jgi:hypothetical protein
VRHLLTLPFVQRSAERLDNAQFAIATHPIDMVARALGVGRGAPNHATYRGRLPLTR